MKSLRTRFLVYGDQKDFLSHLITLRGGSGKWRVWLGMDSMRQLAVVLLVAVVVQSRSVDYDGLMPLPLGEQGRTTHSVETLHHVSRPQMWHGNQQIKWNPARLFKPDESLTFQYIKAGGVDLHFLDHTHLSGFDGQELVSIGPYTVETRLGMITRCNKPLCHRVDGILGFGWLDHDRSPCLFKTLSQEARDDWGISQPYEFRPMPRIFSVTASDNAAEIQLGGYDPDAIDGDMLWMPMSKHQDYGASVASITYGDGEDAVELLQFSGQEPGKHSFGYIGKFDSGTTCILMPNSTLNGMLDVSPFQTLLNLQLKGEKRSLFYTFMDEHHRPIKVEIDYEYCVQPTSYRMILGDPFFNKYVVVHDMQDLKRKRMGLGLRKKAYDLSEAADNDFLGAFAYDSQIPSPGDAVPLGVGGSTMAALKEAALRERTDMLPPEQSMREQGGQGKLSPYKIGATRVVVAGEEGSLAASGHGEISGPFLERLPSARGAPGSLDEVDDMEIRTSSGEPWRDSMEAFEAQEERERMSSSVDKVRLHSDRIVYTIDLGVGTPPQKRRVVFDTGSYVLGVFSAEPPAGSEPLLKDGPVSGAEDDARKRYHVLDLQRSTREVRSWVWGVAGQEGVAGMAAAVAGCSLVMVVAAVFVRRRRRWQRAQGWGSPAESTPLIAT